MEEEMTTERFGELAKRVKEGKADVEEIHTFLRILQESLHEVNELFSEALQKVKEGE